MSLDLARWQFAFTSVSHFLFIPITIGLAFLTALPQTAWQRSGRAGYLRLNPALTAMANAIRVGDHPLERLAEREPR
jgi:cytochrome bd-type quinol oxidase subunit 1